MNKNGNKIIISATSLVLLLVLVIEITTDNISLTNIILMSHDKRKTGDDIRNTFEFSVKSKATNLDGVNYEIIEVK